MIPLVDNQLASLSTTTLLDDVESAFSDLVAYLCHRNRSWLIQPQVLSVLL